MAEAIDRADITGAVLAGGEGRRMGGQDKGLLPFGQTTLTAHALARLAPQAGPLLVSANRHLEVYAGLGVPVAADARPGFAGPLAGLEAALMNCATPWLACVPCDCPHFPAEVVQRLSAAVLVAGADVAYAVSGPHRRAQPLFCLIRREALADLQAWLEAGERRVLGWLRHQRFAEAAFDDEAAFANANTPQALSGLRPAG